MLTNQNISEETLSKDLKEFQSFPKGISNLRYEKITLKSLLEMNPEKLEKYPGLGFKKLISIKDWVLSLGFEMDTYIFLNSKYWNLIRLKYSFKSFERLWRNVQNFENAIASAGLDPEKYEFLTTEFWEKEIKKKQK